MNLLGLFVMPLHPPQGPALPLVGRTRRGQSRPIHSLKASRLDLFGGRRRRKVFVKELCLGFGDVPVRQRLDDHPLLATKWATDLDFIAFSQSPVGLRGLAVDLHFSYAAGVLGI